MKNILLATTGASPQVLTETLYAIHQSGRPFPDEIKVITTSSTKPMLVNGLFRDGHLNALKTEYSLPEFKFDEEDIWLIEDGEGKPIDDAKSIEDQTYMADFIVRRVFELTRDDNTAIHASLAGGRKTMAFYFGYAMSLLGREQDVLSHVFVDDKFEFVRDFWYPTKQSKWVTGKHGQGEVDLSEANVTLAEIPFVRMRNSVDSTLVDTMNNSSFSQAVGMLNASHGDISVRVSTRALTVSAVGVDVKLTKKQMAFYQFIINLGHDGMLVDRDFTSNRAYAVEFLKKCMELGTDERVFGTLKTNPDEIRSGRYCDKFKGMEKGFIQQLCSMINSELKKALPQEVASKITIQSAKEKHDYRYAVLSEERDINIEIVK
ncbi:CRISPR-associated protein [Photobacterium gaetbulicola]|uniref:CRISPR-associated protein n=1 Tax=Photobacterium gaetbulicola TaxID=1295392 RepID=A0A0B9G488_9GAMM|nr:CRISPR-associated ring nuclease Csm6 [Photobacterium gaetbulicola]KHT63553.1 CRISPR-associated protein [Photobacterium gaetbulicola]